MPGIPSSDLVFTIREIEHESYKRNNNDLIYTVKVNLVQALCSEPVELVTLDQRRLRISMTEIVSNETVKKVEAEGMPSLCGKMKGDLFLVFKIQFPDTMSQAQRQNIKMTFSEEYNKGTDGFVFRN